MLHSEHVIIAGGALTAAGGALKSGVILFGQTVTPETVASGNLAIIGGIVASIVGGIVSLARIFKDSGDQKAQAEKDRAEQKRQFDAIRDEAVESKEEARLAKQEAAELRQDLRDVQKALIERMDVNSGRSARHAEANRENIQQLTRHLDKLDRPIERTAEGVENIEKAVTGSGSGSGIVGIPHELRHPGKDGA